MVVVVGKQVCNDDAHAGDVDFLEFNAQATADDCRGAEAGEASFMLTASDGDSTSDPVATNEFGNALFRQVPPGVYTLTETETGTVSEPFDVNQDLQFISVVNYVGAPVTPTITPTPTTTPAISTAPPKPPTTTPHPTQDPGGGKATHLPQDPGGGGKATHPSVAGSAETPAATHPSRVMATVAAVSSGTTRTPDASGTTPSAVTSFPSTGEGTVDAAPIGEAGLVLLCAVLLVVCGAITVRRRVSVRAAVRTNRSAVVRGLPVTAWQGL